MSEMPKKQTEEWYRLFINELDMALVGRNRFAKDSITPCIYFGFKQHKMRFDFKERQPFSYDRKGNPTAFESFYYLGDIES